MDRFLKWKDEHQALLRVGILVILAVVIMFLFFKQILLFDDSVSGILKVTFLDIGQGDSILIEAPNGNQALIDGGPDKLVLTQVAKELDFDDRQIDILMASHPDLDHIGGLPFILEKYQVEYFIYASSTKYSEYNSEILDLVERQSTQTGLKPLELEIMDRIYLDTENDIYFEVLSPSPNIDFKNFKDANDQSLVVMLVYGNTKFLFTGDASVDVESVLISRFGSDGFLDVDVLKVGHHGSDTSSSENFIKLIKPKYSIISAGLGNKFGHPKQSVLDTLSNSGSQILETSKMGNIKIKSDGMTVWLEE